MPAWIRRVLCVDDHEDTCDLLRAELSEHGLDVVVALTFGAAVEIVEAQCFDAFVVDTWLPDGDGNDLCRKIRSRCPGARIVVASAATSKQDREQSLSSGADAFVAKP